MNLRPDTLPPGARLEEFEIERVIGSSGFGIVYLANDEAFERRVAIKEYLPDTLALRADDGVQVVLRAAAHAEAFERGRRAFLEEAQLLARCNHPSLLHVLRSWEVNGTVYRVMPYYAGHSLLSLRQAMQAPPDEASLRALLDGLLDALQTLHETGAIHGDITPANILLLPDDRPVLMDTSAARRAIVGEQARALMNMLAPSFAPREQTAPSPDRPLGPWTDLYAVAAVVRYCISGELPLPASPFGAPLHERTDLLVQRLQTGFPSLSFSPSFMAAIETALTPRLEERPQSVAELRELLEDHPPVRIDRSDSEPAEFEPESVWRDTQQAAEPSEPPDVRGRPAKAEEAAAAPQAKAVAAPVSAQPATPAVPAATQPPEQPALQPTPAASSAQPVRPAADERETKPAAEWRAPTPPAASWDKTASNVAPPTAPTATGAAIPTAAVAAGEPGATIETASRHSPAPPPLSARPMDDRPFSAPPLFSFAEDARRRRRRATWAGVALLLVAVGASAWLLDQQRIVSMAQTAFARALKQDGLTAKAPQASPAPEVATAPTTTTAPSPPKEATVLAEAPTAAVTKDEARETSNAPAVSTSGTEAPAAPTAPAAAETSADKNTSTATASAEPVEETPAAEAPAPRAATTPPTSSKTKRATTRAATGSATTRHAAAATTSASTDTVLAKADTTERAAPHATSPRDACGGRTQFALYRCMQTQCAQWQWMQHPLCKRLRARDEVD